MEIQSFPLLNIKMNKPVSQSGPLRRPASGVGRKPSAGTGEGQSEQAEVLISVSSTVAESNGIDVSGNRLSFSVDEDTGDTVIKIVDNRTGDVIRQLPPDEILSLKKRMGEVQGLLLDKKV